MRDRIREYLSQRDVIPDGSGNLCLLHKTVRAQIAEPDRPGSMLPGLIVDNIELTWDDLGRLLTPYVGSHLRIAIKTRARSD